MEETKSMNDLKRRKTITNRPAYVMINDEIMGIIKDVKENESTITLAKTMAYEYIKDNNEKYLDGNINIKILSLYIEEDKQLVTETKLVTK